MTTFAYTLLASAGGGGDFGYWATFIGGLNKPYCNSLFSGGSGIGADADGNLVYSVKADGVNGAYSALMYYVKKDDYSAIESVCSSNWDNNNVGQTNDTYGMGGSITTGAGEADSGGRFVTAIAGASYTNRAYQTGKPETQWGNASAQRMSSYRSATRPNNLKDSCIQKNDNKKLWWLGDQYNSPAQGAYNTQIGRWTQSSPTANWTTGTSECRELGHGTAATAQTSKGFSIASDSNGNAYVGGQFASPFSANTNTYPWYGQIAVGNLNLNYIKAWETGLSNNQGVYRLTTGTGDNVYALYAAKGDTYTGSGNSYTQLLITKFSGGAEQWTSCIGGGKSGSGYTSASASAVMGLGICVDDDENIYAYFRSSQTSYFNQTDPSSSNADIKSAVISLNSSGAFRWCNVLGGNAGQSDSWDEGKGNRIIVDGQEGLNIMTNQSSATINSSTYRGFFALRVPLDGSGTSSASVAITGTNKDFYYNTSSEITSRFVGSVSTTEIIQYTYNIVTGMDSTIYTNTANEFVVPTDHLIKQEVL
mgnify:CR=1 FL=1